MLFFRLFVLGIITIAALSSAAQQAPKSHWTKVDKAKIHYYDIGKDGSESALVFVHCWTCSTEFWKDSYSSFPEQRVLVIDMPGHGKSDKPRIDYSMELFARSVDAVLKKARVKKAVLIGHSMGTPIIRHYYELYPEKVSGLVIVDGALLTYGPRAEVDKYFAPLFKDDYPTAAGKFIDGMVPADKTLAAYIKSSMLSTPDHVARSAMKLMLDDAYAEHGKMQVPVLAIMAPSPYWPKDLAEQYKAIAPKIDFRIWEGTSHFLHMEKPAEFNSAVTEFLSKNRLP